MKNILFIDNESDLDEGVELIRKEGVLAVDTETTGRDPHTNKVVMLQIGTEDIQLVIDARKVYPNYKLEEILESNECVKLFHNAKFDIGHIYSTFGIEIGKVHDTMAADALLYNGIQDERVSLDDTARRYLGEGMPKTVRGEFAYIGDKDFTEEQIRYGARDVEVLRPIYESQMRELKEHHLLSEMDLENKFTHTLCMMEYNGFYLDPDKWRETVNDKKEKIKDVMKRIDKWIIENGPEEYIDRQPTLFSDEPRACTYVKRGKTYKYIFSSQQETVKFLNKLGVKTQVEDKENGGYKDSVEGPNLKSQKEKFPFLELYLEYKELDKKITSFGDDFLSHINPVTGRVHSNYFHLLSTGRLSSKDPNLQQIPGSEDYRSCFIPQRSDNTLIVSDYSQVEPRIIAHLSGDQRLLEFFNKGSGDSHSFVATLISEISEGERIEVSKENNPKSKKFGEKLRDIGKMINLALNYGKSAYSLKFDLDCSEEEAQEIIDKVQGELTGLRAYFGKVKKQALERGYILIDRLTKRKYYIDGFDEFKRMEDELSDPEFWDKYKRHKNENTGYFQEELKPYVSKYFSMKGNIERKALNFPVQGTSASITKYSMLLLDRTFREENLNAWIVATIHDEIVVECRKNIQDRVHDIMKEKMENAGHKFCPSVKIEAEPVITQKWEH